MNDVNISTETITPVKYKKKCGSETKSKKQLNLFSDKIFNTHVYVIKMRQELKTLK